MRKIAVHIALGILSILMCWTTPTLAESPFADKDAARATVATPTRGPSAEKDAAVAPRPTGDKIARDMAADHDLAAYPPVQLPSAVFVGDRVTPLATPETSVIRFHADRGALECIAQTDARPCVATCPWTLAENFDDMIERMLTVEPQMPIAMVRSEIGAANFAARHLTDELSDDDILVAIANGSRASAGL